MFVQRSSLLGCAGALAAAVLLMLPTQVKAAGPGGPIIGGPPSGPLVLPGGPGGPLPYPNPYPNPYPYPGPIPYPTPSPSPNNNGGGIVRATSSLANPLNFYQWGQVTGVGPIRGTVRIYNQFGLVEQQMQQQNSDPYGGLFGFGNQNQLPGQGTTPGDDPPQGVLLHVNYANMFLPNQQQVGGGNRGGFGYGYPGFGYPYGGGNPFGGGYPYGFGKGNFGNGSSGL